MHVSWLRWGIPMLVRSGGAGIPESHQSYCSQISPAHLCIAWTPLPHDQNVTNDSFALMEWLWGFDEFTLGQCLGKCPDGISYSTHHHRGPATCPLHLVGRKPQVHLCPHGVSI